MDSACFNNFYLFDGAWKASSLPSARRAVLLFSSMASCMAPASSGAGVGTLGFLGEVKIGSVVLLM